MSRLAIYLLGPPRIELYGAPVHIGRTKAVALLAYLVGTGSPHSREALATLLCPESTTSRARASLRRILVTLRDALGEGWLDVQPDSVAIQADAALKLDVTTFRERLAACQTHAHPPEQIYPDCVPHLVAAVELYQDEGLIAVARINERGHFSFTPVEPGEYEIRLLWGEREIRLRRVGFA